MERFYKRTSGETSSPVVHNERSKQSRIEINLSELPSDPGLRTKISDYHPDLAKKLVETRKHKTYPYVYLLITLALVLPVATISVVRAFSAMNIVKNRIRNRMGDQWMNDSLVVYLEKDIFSSVSNESIIQRFQKMAPRRGQL